MAEEIAYPVAANLVSKPLERLFAAIGRQFGYVLCYNSYVEDLKKGVQKLKTAQERVQHSIQEAKNNVRLIENDINNWLESVKEKIEKANDLLKRGESEATCFRGWFPNPVMRHPIGRKVKKITEVIEELFKESQSPEFQKVYYENPAIGTVPANTSTPNKEDVLESRAKIMEDVLKAIVDDKVCVIGVWGVGGVGKSKLLEDVGKRVSEEKLFDVVAKAVLSHPPDLKEIQGDIASALGLELTNNESAGRRANRLHERLVSDPKKKILIILDNLWEKLELKNVGIPYGDDNKVRGCKLLLTSRNKIVLRLGMVCDQVFQLNPLEHEEARRLFERIVGDNVNNCNSKIRIDGVVQKCGGLPLLIILMAKRLNHGDSIDWSNALIKIEGPDVESIVKLNYNDLKEERIKLLFLVCALTSGIISTRNFLVYCMGLGLFKEFSNPIQIARNRLIGDLRKLQDYSLLLEKDDMERFRMHDIFVDVVISMRDKIMDMEWNALVGKQQYGFKDWSEDDLRKCTAISFPYVGIEELPEKLDCPNLRMLLLLENYTSLEIPESFFKSMKKLQVLHFAGLSFTSLTSSMQVLEHLKSLSLDDCKLEDVTLLGKLKGLRFLSFARSLIARLPNEIGELTELRFLDLTRCFRLEIIAPGTLGSLVKLEELYIDSFRKWEAEDEEPRSNASLTELKNMKRLSTLYIATPHSTTLSSDLPFGNLNKYKIKIGRIQYLLDKYKESKTLELELDSSNLLDEVWMQKCLGRTQDLRLDGSRDGRDSIHDLCTEGFQDLKHLYVNKNSSFQYVVDSTLCPAFTKLELLVLKNLDKLEKICHCCLAPGSFSKLKIVKMENCCEIKQLFPSSMKKIFFQLEEIEITGCNLMQQIVADAEVEEYRDEIDDDANVKSCKLRRLTLKYLPEMMSFYKTEDHSEVFLDGRQVSLPGLESLTLSKLPKLKEIWNSQFPLDVTNLKYFKVEDCAFLSSIFPSNLVIKLLNLEVITIERCQLIREVFDLEGLTTTGNVKILSRLTTLTLSDLPRSGYIWNKNPRITLCFRSLRELKVQNCENLRFLFTSSMAKGLQQIRKIKIERCKLLEEIIDVQEEESEEVASVITLEFPLLTSLSLEELSNLKAFSYGTHCVHCPALTRMKIFKCPRMMTFASFKGKQQMITAGTSLHQAFGGASSSLSLPILFNQNVLVPSLEKLTLVSLGGLMKIWHNELSEESFCKLESVEVRDCESLSYIFPSTLIEGFQSLKMIKVVNCTSLESIIEHVAVNTKTRPESLVFSGMKEVKLQDLSRLNALLTSSSQTTLSLPSLTNVSLSNCHRLRYLFTNDSSSTLDKLETLDVSGCNDMQQVVATEESDERKLKAVKFSHLRTLKLCSLKSLISFGSGSCAYEFPYLKNLSILECTELKAFILRLPVPRVETLNEGSAGFDESPHCLFDEKVLFPKLEELSLTGIQSRGLWENEMPNESVCQLKVLEVKQCPNLLNVIPSLMWRWLLHCMESLKVEECPRLRNLFTMSMAKSLVELKYLGLGGCGDMEYIVAIEEEKSEEADDIIVIPQLGTLYLYKMKKLKSFCHEKHISKWPSLKEFTVEDCEAVEVILGDASYRRLEGSVSMQQPLLLVEKVEFPSMESMKISHMDNVEKIWHDELPSNAFTKLKKLIVEYCVKLSSIFSSDSILTRFRNLDKLKVTDCNSLEVVFQMQELNISGSHSTSTFQLRKLKLKRLQKMKHVWSGPPCGTLTFEQLCCLKAKNCESLKSLFPVSIAKSMTQLEELLVQDCGVEEIIAVEGGVGMSAGDLFFPQLTDLRLLELPELRRFYRNSHALTWPHLNILRVRHCGKMRLFSVGTTTGQNQPTLLFPFEEVIPNLEELTLMSEDVMMMMHQHHVFRGLTELELACYHDGNVAFPSDFLLHKFPDLEKLSLSCSFFEEIFPEDACGHGGATSYGESIDVETPLKALKNLEQLELNKLCKLQRVWKDGSLMAEILKQIVTLLVSECSSLSIVLPFPNAFQRLKKLEVKDCVGLVHMGTSSAVTSLVNLTWLTLRNCSAMEDVVTDDGNGVEEISFPMLRWLTLDGLPSLESFSSVNCTFMFPSLRRIIVKQCPKMNIFCNGALSTPTLHKVCLSDEDYKGHWEGDLNTTIQFLST